MTKKRIIVAGAGLVGLSAAHSIKSLRPDYDILILEKENEICKHQSGKNSGVIHSGIYYKPGSLKALNCIRGKKFLEQYCETNQIPFKVCGKLIIATDGNELPQLDILHDKAKQHKIEVSMLEKNEFKQIEPHVEGVKALYLPKTGIINFKDVAASLYAGLLNKGTKIELGTKILNVVASENPLRVITDKGEFQADYFINACGLYSDEIAKLFKLNLNYRIIPFRGEYYKLTQSSSHLCKALIYPVPNPDFPFLGVHFTRMMDGTVKCGPNAVLAMAKEGYLKTDINLKELTQIITFPGFLRFAMQNLKQGMYEFMRSNSKSLFLKSLQKLIPEIQNADIIKTYTGVRAQAISADGKLIDDFLLHQDKFSFHILNAPSPAATSCLSIGTEVAEKIVAQLDNN